MNIIPFILVAIGGCFGAISRFSLNQFLSKKTRFPLGTLTVNLIGSFFLGLVIGRAPHPYIALLIGTGFLGAFTTFSTLSLEVVTMIQHKQRKEMFLYIPLTYGGGILLAFIGYLIGSSFS